MANANRPSKRGGKITKERAGATVYFASLAAPVLCTVTANPLEIEIQGKLEYLSPERMSE